MSGDLKHKLKVLMEEGDAMDMPDGAFWAYVHERAGLEYGDAFDIIADDPEFFGYGPAGETQ